jgi:hypothetical protein
MPISAVVISLKRDPDHQEAAIEQLRADPRLTLGDLQATQLPVVIDTATIAEGIEVVREELPALQGVEFVHVVSVDFSDVEDFNERLPPKRRSQVRSAKERGEVQ